MTKSQRMAFSGKRARTSGNMGGQQLARSSSSAGGLAGRKGQSTSALGVTTSKLVRSGTSGGVLKAPKEGPGSTALVSRGPNSSAEALLSNLKTSLEGFAGEALATRGVPKPETEDEEGKGGGQGREADQRRVRGGSVRTPGSNVKYRKTT